MSVLLTLALPIAGQGADAPKTVDKADTSVETAKDAIPAKDSAPKPGPVTKASSPKPITGKVIETMTGGGYSYANLEKDGVKTWVAFSTQETHLGDTLSFNGCTEMTKFQSKALNRTFDSILFCNAPRVKSGSMGKEVSGKSLGSGGVTSPRAKILVEKASGANAYTVAELFTKCSKLNGKQVVVKGQVVKVASGIMDRTWIHLQDGSGIAKQKNHELVVTSKDTPEVGDVVTVSGTLVKDKDFGSGYKYDVLIEKGIVKK